MGTVRNCRVLTPCPFSRSDPQCPQRSGRPFGRTVNHTAPSRYSVRTYSYPSRTPKA